MDTANTLNLDTVKVKFKGSKLAVGSSKMPSAIVDRVFLETLTPLNKSMIEGAAAFVATKKKKKIDDGSELNNAPYKRKMATRGADAFSQIPPPSSSVENNSLEANGNFRIINSTNNHHFASTSAVDVADDACRDRTLGGIRPCQETAPSTQISAFHALQHNKKQFQKLVDAIDPAEMEITCDYDFWLWLEAQNLFAPFSYKTHDLSVLALQDIGGAAVRERWYQPPQAVATTSSSNVHVPILPPSKDSSASATTAFAHAHAQANGPLSYAGSITRAADTMARELCEGMAGRLLDSSSSGGGGLDKDHHQSRPCGLSSAALEARCGCSAEHSFQDRDSDSTCNLGIDLGSQINSRSAPAASAMMTSTASRHVATAQGMDDLEENSHDQNKISIPDNCLDGLLHAQAHSAECTGISLDEHIQQMNEELLCEHLQANALLARLRKQALQGPAARGELEEANRTADRDKAVLARWRKANSNNSIQTVTFGNGHGAIGKAKTSHKKRLGTY